MKMTQGLIQRYQPGGDIYLTLTEQYGYDAANFVADAAATGDSQRVTEAIATIRSGAARETNVTRIFAEQILTDPLAAPAETVAKASEKVQAALKSPVTWTLLAALAFGTAMVIFARKN